MHLILPLQEEKFMSSLKSSQEPINHLPSDCLLLIFKFLNEVNPSGLIASALVCKKWQRNIFSYELKTEVKEMHKLFFGPQHWDKFLGKKISSDEEIQNAFSILPPNIFEILNAQCTVFHNGKFVKNTHILVYIPEGIEMTLTNLGKLLAKKLPRNNRKQLCDYFSSYSNSFERIQEGYYYMSADILTFQDKSLDPPHWILMTKDLINGSRSKSYGGQQNLVQKLNESSGIIYTIPKTLDAVSSIIAHFLKSDEYLYGKATFTRCQYKIDRHQVVVGNFSDNGLCVNYLPDNNDIGIAVCRIFKNNAVSSISSTK